MTAYTRKSEFVDAERLTVETGEQVAEWANSKLHDGRTAKWSAMFKIVGIHSTGGVIGGELLLEVRPGDWLVIGSDGRMWAQPDGSFRNNFQQVEEFPRIIADLVQAERDALVSAVARVLMESGPGGVAEDIAENVLDAILGHFGEDGPPFDPALALDEAIGNDQSAAFPGTRVLNWITTVEYRGPDEVDASYRVVTSSGISHAHALGLSRVGFLAVQNGAVDR